jgi:hypothetical protein
VVATSASQVFQKLAKVTPEQLGAARSGGGDEPGRDPRIKRRGNERSLAIPRHTGDAHLGRVDPRIRVGLEVVD